MGQAMGSIGSAFKDPNTFAPEPSGFSGSEWIARLMGGAGKGMAQGMGQTPAMRQGGGSMAAPPQASPVVQQQIYDPTKKNSLFYGGE